MELINLKDRPSILPEIAKWHHDEWSQYNPNRTFEKRLKDYESYLNDESIPSMFCLMDKEVVLATCAIVACDMEGKENLFPWIASVYVSSNHRGKGLGKKIMQSMAELPVFKIHSKVYLYTPDQVPFYQKLGWETVEELNYCGDEVVIMSFNNS